MTEENGGNGGGPRLRFPDRTTPEAVLAGRQTPLLKRDDDWEWLRSRLPPLWAAKVREILENAEHHRTSGDLGSTWVIRSGRVTGTRVQRPEEHVGDTRGSRGA